MVSGSKVSKLNNFLGTVRIKDVARQYGVAARRFKLEKLWQVVGQTIKDLSQFLRNGS